MELISTLKALEYDEITGDIVVTDGKNCSCIGMSIVVNNPNLVHTVKFARNVDVATAQVYVLDVEPKLIIPDSIEYTSSSAIFTFSKKIEGDVRFTIIYGCDVEIGNLPDVTPTQTPTQTPPVTPTNTQTPTPTQTVTPTTTPSGPPPTPSPTIDTSQTPTPLPAPSQSPTPSPLVVVSLTPTPTGTPAVTPSPTPTIGATPSITPTLTPTATVTPTVTPTASSLAPEWVGIYSAHDFEGADETEVVLNEVFSSNDTDFRSDTFGSDWTYTLGGGPGGSRTATFVPSLFNILNLRPVTLDNFGGPFGNNVFETSGEITLMFFANILANPVGGAGNGHPVVAIRNASGDPFSSASRIMGLYYDNYSSDSLFWYNRNNTGGNFISITADYSNSVYANTWVHFAQTITNSSGSPTTDDESRLYINGVLFNTTTGISVRPLYNGITGQNFGFNVGAFTALRNTSVAQLRTFSRALSLAEIQYHYNNGNGRPYLT